jgi:hypothetical protein
MTATKTVDIVIYDAPSAGSSGCGCGCGHHDHHGFQGQDHHGARDPLAKVNVELQAKALALTLEESFPGRVRVEYFNVLADPRGPRLPQTALLASLAYPAPLVYINGQGRFAGALPVERIREEVEKILDAGNSKD